MSRGHWILKVSLILVSALCTSFGQAPVLHGMKMLDCSGLPCVDATLASGKHIRLLVDTGDAQSVLDAGVAKQMGLDVAPVNGQDGKPVGYGKATLAGLKIGDGTLGDVEVLVINIAQPVKEGHIPASDGSIAYTAFKDRLLQLDYVNHQLRFSEQLSGKIACPGSCGEITLPTFGKQGPPIVVATGFSVNQKPVTAQVDTMFAGSLLVYPTSVEKLGLKSEAESQKKRFFPYTDDGVDMFEATAATEAFGPKTLAKNAPVYFAGPAVHLPDGMFDATVGQALLEHSVLSLDFHDMKVWIE